ncbi:MAG: DUF4174 domain-containing protein [Pseudomonadota bacterium]
MKKILLALTLLTSPALANTTVEDWIESPGVPIAGDQIDLSDFKWRARALIVFAESEFDPSFIQQMEWLTTETDALIDRDILWVFDTNAETPSDLRRQFRPHGFTLILIGKDGEIKLRKALPFDMREISRSIDKMPLRQLEVEERRGSQMILDN